MIVAIARTHRARGSMRRQCQPADCERSVSKGLTTAAATCVTGITCRVGRKVALACHRLSYGAAGSCAAAAYRWRCRSTNPVGSMSAERCARQRMAADDDRLDRLTSDSVSD
jgi:hypothetical protein